MAFRIYANQNARCWLVKQGPSRSIVKIRERLLAAQHSASTDHMVALSNTHLGVSLQLARVGHAALVPRVRQAVVHEVELVVGAEDGAERVEAVPLGDTVRQLLRRLPARRARVQLHVEVVGEHLLGIAAGGGQQVQAQHQEAGGEEVFGVGGKVKVEGTKSCCLLVGCWCCGGLAGGCSPPSCAARWWG